MSLWIENLWSLTRHDVWHQAPDEFFGPVGEKAIRTLLELAVRVAEFGLGDVTRFLDPADTGYRRAVLACADHPELTRSVEREIMPMINGGDNAALFVAGKFTPFTSGAFRDVTTGPGPRIPFERALDAGVSILIHAPASTLGDIPARTLIGAALRRLWLYLTRRDRGLRTTFLLDEWHRYAAGTVVTMLTESRKYGARLVLANQVLTQLDDRLRNTVLGNTGAVACYRVSPHDARALDGLFPTITIRRLQTLPRHTLAVTRFEDDHIIPGPAPQHGHDDPPDFAAQIDALHLDEPHHRQAVLTRLADALRTAASRT